MNIREAFPGKVDPAPWNRCIAVGVRRGEGPRLTNYRSCKSHILLGRNGRLSFLPHGLRNSFRKCKYDKAIEDFTQVIRLKPNWMWAYKRRGRVHSKKGDRRKAKADFDKAKSLR